MNNNENDNIYTIIGDDGYGMTIKVAKAEKYAKQLRNAFVRKFDDPLSGYVWLSSQINDYNEEFYNSSRVLEQDDLVDLNDLIRQQYVAIPEEEVKKRDVKRKNKKKGCLYVTCGKSSITGDSFESDSPDYNEDDGLSELEDIAQDFLAKIREKKKSKK